MELKKIAVRGLITLAVVVALCMFFSGTIRTITTAKVKLTQGKMGRLEEKTLLDGKLAFPDTDPVTVALTEGANVQITKVNTRVGYEVKEGDIVLEARIADYETNMRNYNKAYDDALEALMLLESKNSGIRIREKDLLYADCYFALRDIKREVLAAKIEMETLLMREGLVLPETGIPENASEELSDAIERYHTLCGEEESTQTALNEAARYMPEEAVWAYISEKRADEEKMAEAEAAMNTLSELNGRLKSIIAPHDGYVAALNVKTGDSWNGTGSLMDVTQAEKLPVIRVDLSELEKTVTAGTSVMLSTEKYGDLNSRILTTGIDDAGKKYADIELTQDLLKSLGSVYALSLQSIPVQLVNRAQQQTTLISASAVHGVGDDRYVYAVDTSYSGFGNAKMTVRKINVTVLGEADGLVSVEEELSYTQLAVMEDRMLNDGDNVMLYGD